MVALAFAVTLVVVMVKAEDTVAPAGTVTDAGTAAAELLLARLTTIPPVGAGLDRVTVFWVVLLPPATCLGDNVSRVSLGCVTVRAASLVMPSKVADMVTEVREATGLVVTVNAGETVAPAGTITDGGGAATPGFELPSVTVTPPAGATPFKVTVPLLDVPPATLDGDTDMETNASGTTVRVDLKETPFAVALMVTRVAALTADVVMVNGGETLAPPGTVTDAGVCATLGFELRRVTTTPPAGAGAFNETVFAVVEEPPATLAGDRVRAEIPAGKTVRVEFNITPL